MTGVPATGLPKITTMVSRNSRPCCRASLLWSMVEKTVMPWSSTAWTSAATVSATVPGAVLVMIPVAACSSVSSAMVGPPCLHRPVSIA